MDENVLFEGSGTVQSMSVKDLYQGILQNLRNVCIPSEYTNCIYETNKSIETIRTIKRYWFELQRRNIITFPIYYGAPGKTRFAEYPEYLSEELQCCRCLNPIPLHANFFIKVENYIKIGTQECAGCTKHPPNQKMTLELQSYMCRLLLNTLRIIGSIVEDKLYRIQRLEREMYLVNP